MSFFAIAVHEYWIMSDIYVYHGMSEISEKQDMFTNFKEVSFRKCNHTINTGDFSSNIQCKNQFCFSKLISIYFKY